MRHAYYLPYFDQTFGDPEYGQGLRELYISMCGDFYTVDDKGQKKVSCSRYCGTSRYDTKDGVKTFLILKNFFQGDKLDVVNFEVKT